MRGSVTRFFEGLDREAWARFFVALLGLIFSFAFAILSSSFRDEGNVLGTAITASLALLTAGIVGIATIPFLARRVALERLRFNVRYELTREGVAYILGVLVIGVAALNTANNLLFIVVAAMLAALLVSGISSTLIIFKLLAPSHCGRLAPPASQRSLKSAIVHLRNKILPSA